MNKSQPADYNDGNRSVPSILTQSHSNPHYYALEATKGGQHMILKHNALAGGGKKKISKKKISKKKRSKKKNWRGKGGTALCPASLPAGNSTWPTFSQSENSFTAQSQSPNQFSKNGNNTLATSDTQAMYDSKANDIPSGLEGGLSGGSSKKTHKRKYSRIRRPRHSISSRSRRHSSRSRRHSSKRPRHSTRRHSSRSRRHSSRSRRHSSRRPRHSTRRHSTRRHSTRRLFRRHGKRYTRGGTWGCFS